MIGWLVSAALGLASALGWYLWTRERAERRAVEGQLRASHTMIHEAAKVAERLREAQKVAETKTATADAELAEDLEAVEEARDELRGDAATLNEVFE